MSRSEIDYTVGNIDERGFINNFTKQGFSKHNCLAEIIANSIDAKAKNIKIKRTSLYILIIDDGNGMNSSGIKKMFSMYSENHTDEETNGVSGLGGKLAIYNLSIINKKPHNVLIYTKTINGELYEISYPCRDILNTGRWTKSIEFRPINNSEMMKYLPNSKGTIIMLPYSDELNDAIDEQFNNKSAIEARLSNNLRLSHIFGSFYTKNGLNIVYEDDIHNQYIKLKMYDYFDDNAKFHINTKYDIDIYNGDNPRFIANINNSNIEYKRKKKYDIPDREISSMTPIGIIKLQVALRYDPDNIYDEDNPRFDPNCKENNSAKQVLVSYDKDFYLDEGMSHHYACKPYMNRNDALITDINNDFREYMSGRANWTSSIKNRMLKWKLSYYTKSNQTNEIDELLGIQLNKQQHSQKLPVNLIHLIDHIYEIEYNKLINKWSELYKNALSRSSQNNIVNNSDRLSDDDDKSNGSQSDDDDKSNGNQSNGAEKSNERLSDDDDKSNGNQSDNDDKSNVSQSDDYDKSNEKLSNEDVKSNGSQSDDDVISNGNQSDDDIKPNERLSNVDNKSKPIPTQIPKILFIKKISDAINTDMIDIEVLNKILALL